MAPWVQTYGNLMELLSYNSDAKTIKGLLKGYVTFILYLAPATTSVPQGGRNVCPWASAGCAAACLFTAGRGAMQKVQQARIRKTVLYFEDRAKFEKMLCDDITKAIQIAETLGKTPCFRLNGTSDINWKDIITQFPHVQFYGYTKSVDRVLENDLPNNHLTFSRSETNEPEAMRVLAAGKNVAVVFSKPGVTEWRGFRVVDGDESDLRFLDPPGVVIGLKAKGLARTDASGFVVDANILHPPTTVV